MKNTLKEKLLKNEKAIGTFFNIGDASVMECLGYSGLDYVIIDTEHGFYDTQTMSDLIKTAGSAGMTPVVRIADVTHKEIQRAADNGAQGLIVPCLRTMDEIKKLVELAKYAPIGNRGFIKGRGSGFGNEEWAAGALEDYMSVSNDILMVLPQCETAECLEQIEEVVKVEGVDGIFVGPFDLSISLGIPAKFDRPEFQQALKRILNACHEAGKPCFIYTNNTAESRKYLEMGFDAVANSLTSVEFTQVYKKLVQEIKA